MDFENKNILVCGMAKSGISAAVLLKKFAKSVTIQDIKEQTHFENETIENLKNQNINLLLGKNPDEEILNFDMLVLSPGVPTFLPFIKKAYENNIPVIGEIEAAFNFCKSDVIGITGTNGKTTTTALIGEIINDFNNSAKVMGNIGKPFSDEVSEMTEKNVAVLELSSFQLETINELKPKISCVLNITEDHQDRHKTMENYVACKTNIFKNQTENDYAILNYDDSYCKEMAQGAKAKKIFFSMKENLKDGIYFYENHIYINILGINEKFININNLKLMGLHNVENVMAAVGAALAYGVPLTNIYKTLENFGGVEHRIEFVKTVNNVDFYNDSKGTNPDSAIKAIAAMTKPIVLIAGGYEKNSDFNEWIKTFKNKVKHVIVLGAVQKRLEQNLIDNNFLDYSLAETFEEAVLKAYELSQSGDCVLLSPACASWGMFNNFEQRGEIFKKIVNSLNGDSF